MNFKYFFVTSLLISSLNADVLGEVLDKSKALYHGVKDKGAAVYHHITKEESDEERRTREFEEVWNRVRGKLVKGSELYSEKENAPESTLFFGTDKADIQEDIDDLLNDIIALLLNDDLLAYQEEIEDLNAKIAKDEIKLAEYKEERVGAPLKSMVHTTKAGYDEKIKNTQDEITIYKNRIKMVECHLGEQFAQLGVHLSEDQIEVLLSRADGNDIIEMTLLIDVLKQITDQILTLMHESGEDLLQAKRYYGMHLVSLALVVHLQQLYIDRVNGVYLPKIDQIIAKASEMMERTDRLMDSEQDHNRLAIYESNYKAQKFTKKVATLYRSELINSRSRMEVAMRETQKNLQVAENTFATVSLSSGLYNLIAQSQMMFDKISRIQMPQIVPFENLQIEQKYKELTKQIRQERG